MVRNWAFRPVRFTEAKIGRQDNNEKTLFDGQKLDLNEWDLDNIYISEK